MIQNISTKEHLPMLDVFRIIICGMIFLFHAVIHKFWIIPKGTFLFKNLYTGAIYMDAFFILSGFLLFYLYGDKFVNCVNQNLNKFYLKRLIRIYPQYFIYTLIMFIWPNCANFVIIPIQILCLQGFFPEIFDLAGNGGTWFISCLIISYLAFPILAKIVNTTKKNLIWMFLFYLFIVYISIYMASFNLLNRPVYINPLYRMLEFMLGMYCAKLFINNRAKTENNSKFILYALAGCVILYVSVALLYNNNFFNHIRFTNHYTYYSYVTIPLFMGIIYSLASFKNKFTEYLAKSKILAVISGLTFPFFIWQGLAQQITKKYLMDAQFPPFASLFIVNMILTIIAYILLDKLFSGYAKKLLLENK